jgi:putative transposase
VAHIDYVHLNPIKHGLVKRAVDWPYSSFHRYLADGVYSADWMGGGWRENGGRRGELRARSFSTLM